MNHKLKLITLSSLIITGCANNPISSYKDKTTSRLNTIYSGNILNAMQAESSDDVLFNMEYGTLLRVGQMYESSNIYFTKAQTSIDNWNTSWINTTPGQITTTTMAMLINDNVNDYEPKGYERTFLPTLHALNNIDLNNLDTARIEIKKMYQTEDAIQNYNQVMYAKAQEESTTYQKDNSQQALYNQIMKLYDFKDINSPQVLTLKNSYQNAFSHYLAGFIFEALNEPSLARPGYSKAGQLNPTSKLIQHSIDNLDKNIKPKKGYTDLLIVEEIGHAPVVKSNQINLTIPASQIGNSENSCPVVINIFYPSLILDKNNSNSYNFNIDANSITPDPMVDLNLMAARAIKDDIPHITSRNIAAALRNITTTQLSCAAGGSIGSLLNLASNVGGILLDQADERNWNLLPGKVNISRTTLPYGTHSVSVKINGNNYTQNIKLDKPYQVITFRIIGNQVYFNPQKSM